METYKFFEVSFTVRLPSGGKSETLIARLIKDSVQEALSRDLKKDKFINEVSVSQPKLVRQ
jgi:hypothetical protein